MNTILTIEFSGVESTKWEVPDENKVNANGNDEYLEYGGKSDIISVSKVMHKFCAQGKPPSRSESQSDEHGSQEETKESLTNTKQFTFPFIIELPEWLPQTYLQYLGSN